MSVCSALIFTLSVSGADPAVPVQSVKMRNAAIRLELYRIGGGDIGRDFASTLKKKDTAKLFSSAVTALDGAQATVSLKNSSGKRMAGFECDVTVRGTGGKKVSADINASCMVSEKGVFSTPENDRSYNELCAVSTKRTVPANGEQIPCPAVKIRGEEFSVMPVLSEYSEDMSYLPAMDASGKTEYAVKAYYVRIRSSELKKILGGQYYYLTPSQDLIEKIALAKGSLACRYMPLSRPLKGVMRGRGGDGENLKISGFAEYKTEGYCEIDISISSGTEGENVLNVPEMLRVRTSVAARAGQWIVLARIIPCRESGGAAFGDSFAADPVERIVIFRAVELAKRAVPRGK